MKPNSMTSPSVPTTQGEREACVVCGKPCEGTTGAVIDDVFRPMCHEGPDPTCYQRWMWFNAEWTPAERLLIHLFTGGSDD